MKNSVNFSEFFKFCWFSFFPILKVGLISSTFRLSDFKLTNNIYRHLNTFLISFKFVWRLQSWFNFIYISFNNYILASHVPSVCNCTKYWTILFNFVRHSSWVHGVQRPRFAKNIKLFRLSIVGYFVKLSKFPNVRAKLLSNTHTLVYPLILP